VSIKVTSDRQSVSVVAGCHDQRRFIDRDRHLPCDSKPLHLRWVRIPTTRSRENDPYAPPKESKREKAWRYFSLDVACPISESLWFMSRLMENLLYRSLYPNIYVTRTCDSLVKWSPWNCNV